MYEDGNLQIGFPLRHWIRNSVFLAQGSAKWTTDCDYSEELSAL